MRKVAVARWLGRCGGLLMAVAIAGCGGSGAPTGGVGSAGADAAGTTGKATSGVAELTSELIAPDVLKKLTGKIQIDGSSSLFPVTEVVGEDFQGATGNNVNVPIAHAGTGGGFKRFVRGEIDICNASRPITTKEREGCAEAGIEFIELPVCFDALTIAVHPSNSLKSITVEQLKAMWSPESEGKVLKWSEVSPDWPDQPLRLFGAGSDSGTFDYFTEAVVGKARSSRTDYTASEDDNALVQGIQGDKGALGYIPFAYYTENTTKIKALAVDWEKDDEGAIEPSLENVLAAKYNPLSRPLFLYINRKSADRPEVRAFIEFYLVKATELVQEVKYMPLTTADYQLVLARFRANQTGSAFDGKPEVGVSLAEILKREPK